MKELNKYDVMRGILSRVLSEEIAHQEQWAVKEQELGIKPYDRDAIINIIREWMKERDIPFNHQRYLDA